MTVLSKVTQVRFDDVDGDVAKRPMWRRKVEGKYRTLGTGSGQYFVVSQYSYAPPIRELDQNSYKHLLAFSATHIPSLSPYMGTKNKI